MKRPTLADIAAMVGVSRTTVSNAYNRPEQLSQALRERILAAAASVGYPGPDPMARSLRTQKTGAIGVLLTEHLSYAFEDAASVDFLSGMAEASYGSELALSLIPVGPETPGVDQSDRVRRALVDGFVVYSVAAHDPHLQAALDSRFPVVICGQPNTVPGVPFVGINDREAIKPAAQAVVAAGHTRIGVLAIRLRADAPVTGPVSHADVEAANLHIQRDRIWGILDVLRAAGLPEPPIIASHINDARSALAAAELMLDTHPELTAIVCTTDSMALGVLRAASARGIAVPTALSVTGFDGIFAARATNLTTVIQPNRRKGAVTGKLLRTLLDDPAAEVPRRTILPTTFSAGATVAPPGA